MTMDANQVNLVAVGLEQFGAEAFVEGNFFDGEVYVDEGKKSYRDLGYRRFNWINIWSALLSQISRASLSKAKRQNISGNLSGDGLQNGGLLIVNKGGTKVLLNHREEVPGDHVANDEILRILGITEVKPPNADVLDHQRKLEEAPNCEEECSIPSTQPATLHKE